MLWIELDRSSEATLMQQLYGQLVSGILRQELSAGARMPSTRELASSVGVSRNLVVEVFEQLVAEGYLETRRGSGTYVTALSFQPRQLSDQSSLTKAGAERDEPDRRDVIAFACGLPDLGRFPRERWLRAARQIGFNAPDHLWGYESSFGSLELREQIRRQVALTKGIDCELEQIVITGGGAHGLALLGLMMHDFRAGAIIEDPTVDFVGALLRRSGHAIETAPVDGEGVMVDELPSRTAAGMLVVSPAHQFPLGGTLTIQRRLALLEFARERDLFLVEDDYDSEFRFAGSPVSALHRLDPTRSIHLGTFSKSLSPSLRLGFLVLPKDLVPLAQACLSRAHLTVSRYAQLTLARFMVDGHLRRHVVRMTRVYERKMLLLTRVLSERFGDRVKVTGNSTGLHLLATFRDTVFGEGLRSDLRSNWGVDFDAAHDYLYRERTPGNALALGFGNLSETQITEGARRLAAGLRTR